MSRTLARRTVAVVATVLMSACGGDDGTSGPPTTASDTTESPAAGALPPVDAGDLEPLYGDALAVLGLRLTDRGGLIDLSGGGYVSSPEGRHLALYVEPIGERSTAEYIDGIQSVGAVFGDVFERWPGLESFDVCQEPTASDDPQPNEPLPTTQIALSREQAADVDWATITVVDMVRAARRQPPGMTVRVSGELSKDPAFEAITAEALDTP